jgi:hypothetical protein
LKALFADNSFTFQSSFISTEQTKGKNGRKRGKSLWQGCLLGSWPASSGAKVICQLAVSPKLFSTKSQERSKVEGGR